MEALSEDDCLELVLCTRKAGGTWALDTTPDRLHPHDPLRPDLGSRELQVIVDAHRPDADHKTSHALTCLW